MGTGTCDDAVYYIVGSARSAKSIEQVLQVEVWDWNDHRIGKKLFVCIFVCFG